MEAGLSLLPMQPKCPQMRQAPQALAWGAVLAAALGSMLPVWSQQSALLESVRQNPQRGKDLCQQLRQLNAEGQSFTGSRVTAAVAQQQGLTPADAEVLVTYVVGFYCPDVR